MIEGLKKSQVENLIEFIELHFIDSIRDDTDIDNIDYVVDMMDILTKLRDTLTVMTLAGRPYEDLMTLKKEKQ